MCVNNSIDWISIFIQALIAIGTISVAVLAIWGDWIRSKLVPPKLKIQPHNNLRGCLTTFSSPDPKLNGTRVIYYHLKVVNSRAWSPAKNCRILLRSVFVRAANQEFVPLTMSIPGQFVWAPAGWTPPSITLSEDHIFDFGRIADGAEYFEPILYIYTNDFEGRVKQGQAIRYALEIVADGFLQPKCQVFEVAWDGIWTDNLEEMARHLTIREVTQD
jgi:hypothetical protein